MTNESLAALRRLNQEIPVEENRGNRLFFQDRLAGAFAIRRAKGQLDNREMFLLSLTGGGTRKCDPKTIKVTPLGKQRALVSCIVTVGEDVIHNTRMFIKEAGRWKVLAWANEPVAFPRRAQ